MKIAAVSGPSATNHGLRRRSAKIPKSGCEKEEVIEASATSAPTIVRFICSFSTRSGRSGEKKLEYESIVR
jgi:hypothetical protein